MGWLRTRFWFRFCLREKEHVTTAGADVSEHASHQAALDELRRM